MRQGLLFGIVIVGMFLVGGIGIGVFLYSLFFPRLSTSNVPSVEEENVGQFQRSQRRFSRVIQATPDEREINDVLPDTDFHVTDRLTATKGTEAEQSITTEPPQNNSSEEQLAVRIETLESEFEELDRRHEDLHQTQQEVVVLLREHNGAGRRALIEELKRLQKLAIEAYDAGQGNLGDEMRERMRQVNEDYGTSGQELASTANAIGQEKRVIGKQMPAIKAELKSLKDEGQEDELR